MTDSEWQEYLLRYERSVHTHFAFLVPLGFSFSGVEHKWKEDIRDYTVYFSYTAGKNAVRVQLAAVSLSMGVCCYTYGGQAPSLLSVPPLRVLNLEVELRKRAPGQLSKPKWLGYQTLRESAERCRHKRYITIATRHMDRCIALLAARLQSYGHMLLPELRSANPRPAKIPSQAE